jgi:hypothetical protein
VGTTLRRVLGGLATWRYRRRSSRWRVAAAALRALRLALCCGAAAAEPGAAASLRAALLGCLAPEGAAASYLFGTLPPDAGVCIWVLGLRVKVCGLVS